MQFGWPGIGQATVVRSEHTTIYSLHGYTCPAHNGPLADMVECPL